MSTKELPPADLLRECFDYDPASGVLTWKIRPRRHFDNANTWMRCNKHFAGKEAGTVDKVKGYRHVSVEGQDYKAHRVIWKWMTGVDPRVEIDHIDGDCANNRWSNLRAADYGEQRWNSSVLSTNTTGRRGVIWNKKLKKWQVAICVRAVRRHLGLFRSIDEASAAYEAAAREAHGRFYRQPQQ